MEEGAPFPPPMNFTPFSTNLGERGKGHENKNKKIVVELVTKHEASGCLGFRHKNCKYTGSGVMHLLFTPCKVL